MELSRYFLFAYVVRVAAIGVCYNPGPAFPPVNYVLNQTHFNRLSVKLDKVIKNVLDSPDGWTTNITSFAVQITSIKETLWSHFYTAPILGEYEDSDPTAVTGDTAFRVASISKTFTVYAVLLQHGINLEDPVTKYIPELLEGEKDDYMVQWDQITIRSLASQLSGISRETGLSDLAVDTSLLPDPVASGFPPIDEQDLAPCMKNSTDRACKASEIIRIAKSRQMVFFPNDRSTYSNVGFSLLGMVLEKVTGNSYTHVVADSILLPLQMEHTRTSKPKDSDGIIPWGPNDWKPDLGADIPSGGIYSTANDFSKYLQSILSSTLLPKATVNAWMKPHSWTSSGANSAYGMPWEIMRTTKATPDGRPIDIITKGGSLRGYFSTIALLPEFGLGVTFLTAGAQVAVIDLRERIFAALISEVDKMLREEIRRSHCGTYAFREDYLAGPPNMDWSFSVEVDDTGPGLVMRNWTSNGTDFLHEYGRLKHMPADPELWEARLLPTGIYHDEREEESDLDGGWDIWRLNAIPKRKKSDRGKLFEDYCMTDIDALMYGGLSVEEFTFFKSFNFKGMGQQAYIADLTGMRKRLLKGFDCEGRETGEVNTKSQAAMDGYLSELRNAQQEPMVFG